MHTENQFIWYLKYQPQKVADCALPERIKNSINKFILEGDLPNMLFFGPAGVGKTTLAKAAIKELGGDLLFINGSLDRGIDMIRNDIEEFASSMSFNAKTKYVIIDEADGLNEHAQKALRGVMESYSDSCRFILTCNYPNKIIEPIRSSRLAEIDFNYTIQDFKEVIPSIYKMIIGILDNEGISYDREVIKEMLKSTRDIRRLINKMQKYSNDYNEINTGILTELDDKQIQTLVEILRKAEFDKMREWVTENESMEFSEFINKLYSSLDNKIVPETIPVLIIHLNEFDREYHNVSSKKLHIQAMLTHIMSDCKFK